MSVVSLAEAEVFGWPLIPAGEYLATYRGYELSFIFKQPKCFVHFEIAEGTYRGMRLYRPYRVKRIKKKTKRGGQFEVSTSHKLYRQFVGLTHTRERPDRFSLNRLKGCLIRVSVVTVETDGDRKPIPEAAQYSRIDEMLSIETGSV